MTTTTHPHIPPPVGADWVADWEGEGDDEGRFFQHPEITVGESVVFIAGVQYANGESSRSVRVRSSLSTADEAADFTPQAVRQLAAMLQNLADTCEVLDGIEGRALR